MNKQPKILSVEELVKLAKKMCAAKSPRSAEKLRVKLMEGFYGRRMLPEELRTLPHDPAVDKEWIANIISGEAREIFREDKP